MKKLMIVAALALMGGGAQAFTTSTPTQPDRPIVLSITKTGVTHIASTIFLPSGEVEVSLIWSYSANGTAQLGGAWSLSSTLAGAGTSMPATGGFDNYMPMVSGVEYTRHLQVPAGGRWLYIVDRSGDTNLGFPSGVLANNAFVWVEIRKNFGHTPLNSL